MVWRGVMGWMVSMGSIGGGSGCGDGAGSGRGMGRGGLGGVRRR